MSDFQPEGCFGDSCSSGIKEFLTDVLLQALAGRACTTPTYVFLIRINNNNNNNNNNIIIMIIMIMKTCNIYSLGCTFNP